MRNETANAATVLSSVTIGMAEPIPTPRPPPVPYQKFYMIDGALMEAIMRHKIGADEKLILLSIATTGRPRLADNGGEYVWDPSETKDHLGDLGLTRSAYFRARRKLIDDGLVIEIHAQKSCRWENRAARLMLCKERLTGDPSGVKTGCNTRVTKAKGRSANRPDKAPAPSSDVMPTAASTRTKLPQGSSDRDEVSAEDRDRAWIDYLIRDREIGAVVERIRHTGRTALLHFLRNPKFDLVEYRSAIVPGGLPIADATRLAQHLSRCYRDFQGGGGLREEAAGTTRQRMPATQVAVIRMVLDRWLERAKVKAGEEQRWEWTRQIAFAVTFGVYRGRSWMSGIGICASTIARKHGTSGAWTAPKYYRASDVTFTHDGSIEIVKPCPKAGTPIVSAAGLQ